MPRTGRLVLDGGTYHVLTRGNNGQAVFHQEADYRRYFQLLAEHAKEHQLKLYHFALMPNHVHLVLEATHAAGLSRAMHGLNLTYALFYQRRRQYRGHLWQGRFKSLLIDRESYFFMGGTMAAMANLEQRLGLPSMRRPRGRPRKNRSVPISARGRLCFPIAPVKENRNVPGSHDEK